MGTNRNETPITNFSGLVFRVPGGPHSPPPPVSEAGQLLYFHSVTHLSIKTRIIIKKLGCFFFSFGGDE